MEFYLTHPETRDKARMREFEAHLTSPPVVLEFNRWLQVNVLRSAPKAYLGPSTGAGIWPQIVRRLWPGCVTVGVEPREEESVHVARNCDEAHCPQTFEEYLSVRTADSRRFDLLSENPPFTLAFTRGIEKNTGKVLRRSWIEQILESDLLVDGGILAFLGRSQWGQSREAWPIIERHPPVHQVRSGGRLSFADTGSTASDEYSMWVWIKGHPAPAGPTWTTSQLAPMPEGRRWADIPGTYELPNDLFEGCYV